MTMIGPPPGSKPLSGEQLVAMRRRRGDRVLLWAWLVCTGLYFGATRNPWNLYLLQDMIAALLFLIGGLAFVALGLRVLDAGAWPGPWARFLSRIGRVRRPVQFVTVLGFLWLAAVVFVVLTGLGTSGVLSFPVTYEHPDGELRVELLTAECLDFGRDGSAALFAERGWATRRVNLDTRIDADRSVNVCEVEVVWPADDEVVLTWACNRITYRFQRSDLDVIERSVERLSGSACRPGLEWQDPSSPEVNGSTP